LESAAVGATAWTILAYGGGQALRIVNSLLLSHLLAPDSFGLMTLLTTFIIGITLLSDLGIQEGVVQNPRGDEPLFLNTAWTIQALRGTGIWLCSCIIAWPLAHFYKEPRLLVLLPVLGFGSVLTGFWSTNLLTLGRHLSVKRLYTLDLATQICQTIVTIAWAYFFPSVWALLGGTLLASLLKLVVSHTKAVPGIKSRFAWDKESAQSLIHFGRWILFGTAAFFFASQADRLILGKLIDLALLGVYGIAFAISDIPRQVILMFCSRVGHPFIVKLVNRPRPEFRTIFLQYRFYVLIVGALLLAVITLAGGPVVLKLYDSRYRDAAWMIPILALGLWHTLLYSTLKPGLYSVGKTNYNAIGNAFYLVCTLVLLPVGFRFWGMTGAVIAVAASDFPLYVVNSWGAYREGISSWSQDAKATAVFIALLLAGYYLRMHLTL
jgi:O-antigen/teichoic acid export membrane protein